MFCAFCDTLQFIDSVDGYSKIYIYAFSLTVTAKSILKITLSTEKKSSNRLDIYCV